MSVYSRGKNTWRIDVFIGYDSNGKKLRATDTYIGNKKEAKALEAKMKEQIKLNKYVDRNKYTFEMFSKKWLNDYAFPSLSPKTSEVYESLLELINLHIGHIKLSDIRALHLIEFYNFLRKKDNKNKPGQKLSENTVLHYYAVINRILNHAVKWQFIATNPNMQVDRPKPKRKLAKCYDTDQVKALLEVLENESAKYRALILLALDSGARRGEITGLEWDDINFITNTIKINKTTQALNNGRIIEKSTKNDSSVRNVIITKYAIEALKEYKIEQEKQKEIFGDNWLNSKKVFTTIDGGNMHPDTPSKIFNKILRKYNLPIIPFHSLRHTSVSLLANQGIQTQVISKRVGHSSITTTSQIYSHIFEASNI